MHIDLSFIIRLSAHKIIERAYHTAGAMQAEMSRLERQSSSLVSDLGTRTGENLLLDGLVVSLKSQVETLREELTSTQRAYREQMEISRSELDDQWEEKMNALRDSQSRNLENAFIACRKSHSAEVLELNAKFDREKKSLEGSLVRISSEASADSARHQRDLVFAMENLQAEKDSHSLSVMRLNQQNEADRNELEQRLRTELETHLASAQATAEEKERLACEGHDAVISLMKDMCKKALGTSHFLASSIT